MSDFDPRRARAKRPFPLWVDAWKRDTMDFTLDEEGAYQRLLMAIWSNKDCAISSEDTRLAQICGVSKTIWKRRYAPKLLPLFLPTPCGKFLTHRKLLKEAYAVEKFCLSQSEKRDGKASRNADSQRSLHFSSKNLALFGNFLLEEVFGFSHVNALISLKAGQTGDFPGKNRGTDLPNNPTVDNDDDPPGREISEDERLLEMIHSSLGISAEAVCPQDVMLVGKWRAELGLSPEQINQQVLAVMGRRRQPDRPQSLNYFTRAMQQLAGSLEAPPLQPDVQPLRQGGFQHGRPTRHAVALAAERIAESFSERPDSRCANDH